MTNGNLSTQKIAMSVYNKGNNHQTGDKIWSGKTLCQLYTYIIEIGNCHLKSLKNSKNWALKSIQLEMSKWIWTVSKRRSTTEQWIKEKLLNILSHQETGENCVENSSHPRQKDNYYQENRRQQVIEDI